MKAELASDIVESLAIAFSKFPFRPLLEPTDGDNDNAHARKLSCVGAIRHAPVGIVPLARLGHCLIRGPHLLEIVKLSNLGPEHVHNYIAGIDQHPIAIRQTFDVRRFQPALFKAFGDILRNRADVTVCPPRGHDHEVRDR